MTDRPCALVVDDEPDIRAVIRAMLVVQAGIVVSGEASSAAEAVEMARAAPPDLIVLDHWLGSGKLGIEAARELKEAAPEAKVLLISGHDVGRAAGAEPAIDAFLAKTDVDRLVPTVRRLLATD